MAQHVVILVGHGGVPSDFPRDSLTRLKALEGRRRASGTPMTEEERTLDHQIRHFPRTDSTDPYRAGLEKVAFALEKKVFPAKLLIAYNEFCAPSLEEAAALAIGEGAQKITVIPSMVTPGGVHSEVEIPETLAALRNSHPKTHIVYAWPFELDRVADLFADLVVRKST